MQGLMALSPGLATPDKACQPHDRQVRYDGFLGAEAQHVPEDRHREDGVSSAQEAYGEANHGREQ